MQLASFERCAPRLLVVPTGFEPVLHLEMVNRFVSSAPPSLLTCVFVALLGQDDLLRRLSRTEGGRARQCAAADS